MLHGVSGIIIILLSFLGQRVKSSKVVRGYTFSVIEGNIESFRMTNMNGVANYQYKGEEKVQVRCRTVKAMFTRKGDMKLRL